MISITVEHNKILTTFQALQKFLKTKEEHLGLYTQATTSFPDIAVLWWIKGRLNMKCNNSGAALADYNIAIEKDPILAVAYAHRGEVNEHMQNYQAAIADYSSAIAIDGEASILYRSHGTAHHGNEFVQGSRANQHTAIINPNFIQCYTRLASIYLNEKMYIEAEAVIIQAQIKFNQIDSSPNLQVLDQLYQQAQTGKAALESVQTLLGMMQIEGIDSPAKKPRIEEQNFQDRELARSAGSRLHSREY